MLSSVTSSVSTIAGESAAGDVLRWRTWPVVDQKRWSWVAVLGVLVVGTAVGFLAGRWTAGLAAAAAVAVAGWQFFVPVTYEIYPLGLRRRFLGRAQLVPWHAVRAYRVRATGMVLYRCTDPTAVDVLRSLFLPYPDDADEMLSAAREFLAHAVELP